MPAVPGPIYDVKTGSGGAFCFLVSLEIHEICRFPISIVANAGRRQAACKRAVDDCRSAYVGRHIHLAVDRGFDIAARKADIGQGSVAEPSQMMKIDIATVPGSQRLEDTREHDGFLDQCAMRQNRGPGIYANIRYKERTNSATVRVCGNGYFSYI